jgi:hypothetical protein
MSQIDLLLTAGVVGAALAFLVGRLTSRSATPPCHRVERALPTTEVVVGAALARGLRAAHARKRSQK